MQGTHLRKAISRRRLMSKDEKQKPYSRDSSTSHGQGVGGGDLREPRPGSRMPVPTRSPSEKGHAQDSLTAMFH